MPGTMCFGPDEWDQGSQTWRSAVGSYVGYVKSGTAGKSADAVGSYGVKAHNQPYVSGSYKVSMDFEILTAWDILFHDQIHRFPQG